MPPEIYSGKKGSRNAQLPEAGKTEILAIASLARCQQLDQNVWMGKPLAQVCSAVSATLLNPWLLSQVL